MRMFSSASERALLRRVDDQAAAGQAFADVVVGIAFHLQRHARGQPGAEALTGAAVELEVHGVVRKHLRAHLANDRLDSMAPTTRLVLTMVSSSPPGSPLLDGRLASSISSLSSAAVELVVLLVNGRSCRGTRPALRRRQQLREVEAAGFPVIDRLVHVSASTRPIMSLTVGSRARP